jgi:glutamate racemase
MIGVFDSGVGGLSVLRALRRRLPDAPLHYLADSAYAPYGDRTPDEVIARSRHLTSHLLAQGARMIVVACNTATTTAIAALRSEWPQVPFVGVEPGVKPAAARSRNRRIGVLATRRTIASARLRSLVEQHAAGCNVVLQPCPGLADAIEQGDTNGAAIDALLDRHCQALRDADVDTVVLGCTHYPFVADRLQSRLGEHVILIDTADAVAERIAQLWALDADCPAGAEIRLETTGDPLRLGQFAHRWLGVAADRVHRIACP